MGFMKFMILLIAVIGSYGQTCRDEISDCYQYTKSACRAPYDAWARKNCALYCGFCKEPCVDKISDCSEYGKQACQGVYTAWAKSHCARYCGFCTTILATAQPYTSGVRTNTSCYFKGVWHEKGTNWMDGCEHKCTCLENRYAKCFGVCPIYPTPLPDDCQLVKSPGECCEKAVCNKTGIYCSFVLPVGQKGGCLYKGKMYDAGEQWKDGCAIDCTCYNRSEGIFEQQCKNICPKNTNIPVGCSLIKKDGKCCSEVACTATNATQGQSDKCTHKGKTYNYGDTWVDGCDFRCSCQGSSGDSRCYSRCVIWTDLPQNCTLQDPAPGKCCKKPKCPDYVVLNYPPGYVEE